jgi:hypothetical protein
MYDLRPDIKLLSMAVSRDGRQAYIVTDDPTILRYDLSAGKQDESFAPPPLPGKDARIAVSPNGKMIAVGIFGKVTLYDSKTSQEIGRFNSQLNLMIYGLRFASGGRSIVVHGNGPVNYEYDIPKGTPKRERRLVGDKTNAYTYHMQSANGMLAAAGMGALAAWPENSSEPAIQATISGAKVDVKAGWASVAPDGKHLVSSHGIWDVENGQKVVRFIPRWNPQAMALTEDGARLVIGGDKMLFVVPSCLTPTREHTAKQAREPRTWTDTTGKFTVKAVLEKVDAGTVVLRKTDGAQIEVPIEKLCSGDRQYLDDLDK